MSLFPEEEPLIHEHAHTYARLLPPCYTCGLGEGEREMRL